MNFGSVAIWIAVFASFAGSASARILLQNYDFQVPEFSIVNGEETLVARLVRGNERRNNSLNRLSMISENQLEYPEPESGCAPIAILNILVWYEKYGLIEPHFRISDPATYKSRLFEEIDERILEKLGTSRTESGGTSVGISMVVIDEMVKRQSDGELRIHANHYPAPLQLKDLLDTMPNFRAGFVFGRPIDPETGQLQSNHAMSLIRADRAGYVTLASWGEKYRGLLRMRNGKQVFIPQNPEHLEIEIKGFYRFIPFQPTTPEGR